MQAGVILGVEGAEGTDRLVARCKEPVEVDRVRIQSLYDEAQRVVARRELREFRVGQQVARADDTATAHPGAAPVPASAVLVRSEIPCVV